MTIRKTHVIAVVAVFSAACNDARVRTGESVGDSSPVSANAQAGGPTTGAVGTAAAVPAEFRTMVGLARFHSQKICVAIPVVLQLGDQITLIETPITGSSSDPAKAHAAQVVASAVRECGVDTTGRGIALRGDSLYQVTIGGRTPANFPVSFALALPLDKTVVRNDSVFAKLDNPERMVAFRACTSMEGLHMTAWLNAPITGLRVWHRYHYVGYDMEVSCLPVDTEGTGG